MNTQGYLKEQEPIAISSMWRLPRQLDFIDAIFERPGDGVVVIFRGQLFTSPLRHATNQSCDLETKVLSLKEQSSSVLLGLALGLKI